MKTEIFLDDEEKDLVEAYESGEFVNASNLETRKKELKQAFKTTTSKRKSINIRVLEADIQKIKTKAIEE
jgi:predicted DNA binding CopG/RHH family protein